MRVETLSQAAGARRGAPSWPAAGVTLPTAHGRHLVALDIDGTLLHHDGTLSPVVADAVTAARAAGHEIVIATGRSLVAARQASSAWAVIWAANGCVASTTHAGRCSRSQAPSPSAPPKPPTRSTPAGDRGFVVRPASDVVTSQPSASSRVATARAWSVPPRSSTAGASGRLTPAP